MLSQENINKLCMTGLYRHEPDVKYRGSIYENQLFYVAIGSGGTQFGSKWFVKKDAKKNKDKVISRLNDEIKSLETKLLRKKQTLEEVIHGDIDLKYL